MSVCTSLSQGLICPLLFPEHPCVDQRFAEAVQVGWATSALPTFSLARNRQRPEKRSAGGTALPWLPPPGRCLPRSVLSHLHSAVEMRYFSSLLGEIQSRAINTYQLGRNFPANVGLCPDRESLDAAAPGAGAPAAHRYPASGFGFFIGIADGLTSWPGS